LHIHKDNKEAYKKKGLSVRVRTAHSIVNISTEVQRTRICRSLKIQ